MLNNILGLWQSLLKELMIFTYNIFFSLNYKIYSESIQPFGIYQRPVAQSYCDLIIRQRGPYCMYTLSNGVTQSAMKLHWRNFETELKYASKSFMEIIWMIKSAFGKWFTECPTSFAHNFSCWHKTWLGIYRIISFNVNGIYHLYKATC